MKKVKQGISGLEELPQSEGLLEASRVLNLMSHPERLRVLCHLTMEEELSVGELLERIDLSGSALSQHLAKLREHGLVMTRKEKQTVFYRVGRDDVGKILETLHGLYCDI
ncbi:MAG: ArsR/SmtB family transcription factor [Puniceicoccaceae bacterium]